MRSSYFAVIPIFNSATPYQTFLAKKKFEDDREGFMFNIWIILESSYSKSLIYRQ